MASPWLLTGNAGTNPKTDFVGTSDNQPLVIKSASGKVGIGTETPAANLDVGGGLLRVGSTTNPITAVQGAYLGWNALTGGRGETDFINNQGLGAGGFAFMNTPNSVAPRTTLMVITGSGNVGIGTSTPTSQLHLNVAASPNPIGALTIDVQSFETEANAQASHFLMVHDIGAAPPHGATHFAIRGDGYVGIGTPQPSARLSVVLPNTGEIAGRAKSSTLLTSSGALGAAVGSDVALASFGIGVDNLNSVSLGVRAVRAIAAPQGWPSTAIGLVMDVDNTTRAGAALFLHANGNVGIGKNTTNPVSVLEAANSAPGALGPALTLTNTGGGVNAAVAVNFNTFLESSAGAYNPSSRIEALDDGNFANDIVVSE